MWYFTDYSTYNRRGVQALIRFIRNAFRHIDDVIKECGDLFKDANGFHEYFCYRYPYLILEALNVVRASHGDAYAYGLSFDDASVEE